MPKSTTGIRRREGKRGVTYRAEVCVDGKRASKSFKRKTDAVAWKRTTESEMQDGRWRRPAEADRQTFSQLVDRYLEWEDPDRNYRRHLRWWKQAFKQRKLTDIESVDIEDQIRVLQTTTNNRGETLSAGTINRYIATLSVLYSAAVRWKWVPFHPMLNKQIKRPKEPSGRVRCLNSDERERLLSACREDSAKLLYPLVLFALSTGARAGEILSLTWSDIDFKASTATVRHSKNGERRLLPLNSAVLDNLHELRLIRRIDTNLVFPSKEGITPWHYRKPWLRALKRAGIENFRFHDLRHSCASYLAMNGATLNDLKAILGHKTLSMVQRYAHLNEAHMSAVVRSMNERVLGL